MERKLIINSGDFATEEAIHTYIKDKLGFPEYYGKNLSALYDCLTDICEETFVELHPGIYQSKEMDEYFQRVAVAFIDAQLNNNYLHVKVIQMR